MSYYDYRAGKKRIKEILDNKLEVKNEKIPKTDSSEFTYDNSFYHWVGAIFVDIRDSSTLFSEEDKIEISKIIRSFTSEIIEILRDDNNLREIGVRGDCVYGIYSTPLKSDILELADKTFYINTFMSMLNKLLKEKGFLEIKVGIGMAVNEELVVKAGRKGTGINNAVWIGDAVTKASNLSSLGNKNNISCLCFSTTAFDNFIDGFKKRNEGIDVDSWFTKEYSYDLNSYFYSSKIVKLSFDNWINGGMLD